MNINNRRELWIARTSTFITLIGLAGLFNFLFLHIRAAVAAHHTSDVVETIVFITAMFFVAYGNLLYQICLAGYHKRLFKHRPASRAELESLYGRNAPTLAVLVPSYKEEHTVIWQTLVSAALAEYPGKDVVLLIDDPHRPSVIADMRQLEESRRIPLTLQQLFDVPHARFSAEFDGFMSRRGEGKAHPGVELNRLSILYDEAADWLDALAGNFIGGRAMTQLSHIDRFFVGNIMGAPAQAHRERAAELRRQMKARTGNLHDILIQYRRLAGLFNVRFTSFERKKYANLSHEANKAMNLNSYISLMGKSWKEVGEGVGMMLVECTPQEADFSIAAPDFVNTIDADSMMLCDYALKLVHMMQQPRNRRLAVVQSPCSAYPGATGGIERAAGAAIDMQFETHQGYTHWDATFWVGANAMLRFSALADVHETRVENGHRVSVFIKDRTVIEDTESSIDLVHKGWRLRNYPERLTFSSMPADFGSLLIQRRRWANGGLLILPTLLRYAVRAPKDLALVKECFMRLHYLISSASGCLVALLLFIYSLGDTADTLWLPASALPFFALYIRDLRNSGYGIADLLRIFALNLMLLPVLAGGVLKSIEQMATGRKIPFSRTPKVPGRTAAPALYSLIEILLPFLCLGVAFDDGMHHHWVAAVVASINCVFLAYTLVFFLGVKETFEDIVVGTEGMRSALGRKAEGLLTPLRKLRYPSLVVGSPNS